MPAFFVSSCLCGSLSYVTVIAKRSTKAGSLWLFAEAFAIFEQRLNRSLRPLDVRFRIESHTGRFGLPCLLLQDVSNGMQCIHVGHTSAAQSLVKIIDFRWVVSVQLQ